MPMTDGTNGALAIDAHNITTTDTTTAALASELVSEFRAQLNC